MKKFDPLVYLPEDVLNIIFEYLSCSDLLKMSLVSMHWYNLIGRTDGMKKIQIVFRVKFSSDEIDCLMKSSRLYQNISFLGCWELLLLGSSYKMHYEREAKVILKRFSGTIKSIVSSYDFECICDLPNFKKLKFRNFGISPLSGPYTTGLLSKIEYLEELCIDCSYKLPQKMINNALKTMKKLKVLEICNFMDGTEYAFKLHTFIFKPLLEMYNYLNVLNFLKSQSSSLKRLKLRFSKIDSEEIISLIMNMPNITHLGIECHIFDKSQFRVPNNSSIRTFNLQPYYNDAFLRTIMGALKNVEVLNVDELNSKYFKIILQSTTLRTVNFVSMNLSDEQESVANSHSKIKFNSWDIHDFKKFVW